MDHLLFHPDTQTQLKRFSRHPTHAVMLLAPDGSGKGTVAAALAAELLAFQTTDKLRQKPAVVFIEPDPKTIPIDAIRQLQRKLQLKTIGKSNIRRVVIIEAAHRMTHEAQNALLKVLEEPPEDSVFILTAPSAKSVLPTIYSRSQHIEVKMPSQAAVTAHFSSRGFTQDEITRALRYSGQRIGLAHAILQHDATHPLLEAVQEARTVLGIPLLERLLKIEEWTRQKDELPERLDALSRICQAGLYQAAESGDNRRLKQWKGCYQAVYATQGALVHNPNHKLLLTSLFLQLS